MENQAVNRRKVLVLDDERQGLIEVRDAFSVKDFDVVNVGTIDEALLQLENTEKLDAFWFDHHVLGRSDGFELILRIKDNPRWSNIPLFMVSSNGGVWSCLNIGMDCGVVQVRKSVTEIIEHIVHTI